jgi:MFS family permease
VLLLWTASWVGGAILSRGLGRVAETYGHRPVLVLSTLLKPLNMVALVLVPQDPQVAFWILVPVFALDAVLNAGIAIASNGFMLRNSPTENRTMYIAAGTALAGIIGGVTSIAAGGALSLMSATSIDWGGITMTGFHVLFGVSLLLRVISAIHVHYVREAHAQPTTEVVIQLIGATPLRMLLFPVGLYRTPRHDEAVGGARPVPAPLSARRERVAPLAALSLRGEIASAALDGAGGQKRAA